MTTDFRALCAELLEAYETQLGDLRFDNRLAKRARAALAEPEPEGSTDEELRELWNEGWDTSEEYGAFKFARAVLARWGTPNSAETRRSLGDPAAGEVAELVAWLRERGQERETLHLPGAELSKQLRTAPFLLTSAASLLERLSPPQPVPVAERLPGPGDCDAEGRCWWWYPEVPGKTYGYWAHEDDAVPERALDEQPSHWLPAYALPLPS